MSCADYLMLSSDAQLLFLWAGSSSDTPQGKNSLPNKVTSAKNGPLSLNGTGDQVPPIHFHPTTPRRRNTLTKFPVILETPMEIVEKQLGTLSCAELKNALQVIIILEQVLTNVSMTH